MARERAYSMCRTRRGSSDPDLQEACGTSARIATTPPAATVRNREQLAPTRDFGNRSEGKDMPRARPAALLSGRGNFTERCGELGGRTRWKQFRSRVRE